MERPPLPSLDSNPLHFSKHRLLLSCQQRRNSEFRRRCCEYLLQKSVWDKQCIPSLEFLDMSLRVWESACGAYWAVEDVEGVWEVYIHQFT